MRGALTERDGFLIGRKAILDYLGISKNTFYAWLKKYRAPHPNPLPVGKMGGTLISIKAKLDAWRIWHIEQEEKRFGTD